MVDPDLYQETLISPIDAKHGKRNILSARTSFLSYLLLPHPMEEVSKIGKIFVRNLKMVLVESY